MFSHAIAAKTFKVPILFINGWSNDVPLKAFLFDLDGTLADTDPVHLQVFAELLAPHGYDVDEEFFRNRIAGGRNRALFQNLFPGMSDEEADRRGNEKEELFRQRASNVAPIPGLSKVLSWAEENGLRFALVTNARRANVDFLLPLLGLGNAFEVKVVAEDVAKGKPDPAPYALALERLGLSAGEAVVFEDSPTGIRSAVGAGIFTYGLKTTHSTEELLEAGANIAIADFLDDGLWKNLLGHFA